MLKGMHLTSIGNRNMLLEPGDGLDPGSPDEYVVELMQMLQKANAQTLMYDLDNVPLIDAVYYAWLVKLHRLCLVSNMDFIVTNIRPTAAFSLATSLKEAPLFKCSLDVDSARQGIVVNFKQ